MIRVSLVDLISCEPLKNRCISNSEKNLILPFNLSLKRGKDRRLFQWNLILNYLVKANLSNLSYPKKSIINKIQNQIDEKQKLNRHKQN